MKPKPILFDYLDYRTYLNDWFNFRRNAGRKKYTYRQFALDVRYSTPNFLKMVVERKLNMSAASLNQVCRTLQLNKKETAYFSALVEFDQAKSHSEKNDALREILQSQTSGSIKSLDKNQYEYFSKWYHPVVRELITSREFGSVESICNTITPSVTAAQVRKSIKLLELLNLIRFDSDTSVWRAVHNTVSTPSEALSPVIMSLHSTMLDIADKALSAFSAKQRDFRMVTMGIPAEKYPELKKKVESFWREILDFADEQQSTETVMQFNMQLFPLVCTGADKNEK